MIARIEKVAIALLLAELLLFFGLTIRSFAYDSIVNGERVEVFEADDYDLALEEAEAEFVDITESPDIAEVTVQLNPYEEIAARTTDEEWELLRWIVCLEANNQTFDQQCAVVETIFNRVLSPKWTAPWGGDTIGEVLRGKHQYSTLRYVGSSKAWATPNQTTDDVIAETIRRGPATVLPSTKYVYFDSRGGLNGINHIRLGAHTFGAEK